MRAYYRCALTYFLSALALCLSLTLGSMGAQAQARWNNYVSNDFGFSIEMPGTINMEIGATRRGTYVGTKEKWVYKSAVDNIEYSIGVANFRIAQENSETILLEALDLYQGTKPVLMDNFGRVGEGREMIYGRKITVELPNGGGQETAAFYFANGNLYELYARVPAGADLNSTDPMRFIDSVSFDISAANPNATALEPPPY